MKNRFLPNKKHILQLIGSCIFSLIVFSTCEKDDFCIDNPVTPKLVIRFYDNFNRDLTKRVDRLSIFLENAADSIIKQQNTDSIAIPLNPADFLNHTTKEITFIFRTEDEKIANTEKEAKLKIAYIPQEDYVSRSCGFRVIFNEVALETIESGWIKELNTEDLTTIDNQNAAHIQIFH